MIALLAVLAFIVPFGPAPQDGPPTVLRITVWPTGYSGASRDYTLRCAPPRGTVPRPARACDALGRLGPKAFAPTPKTMACTDIFGGPAKAWVYGYVYGQPVDARLSLVNGCEVARWRRVAAVVPGASA
jgi:Subtilisin inhibitor-like